MSQHYEMAAIISDALAIPKPGEKAIDSIRVAERLTAAGYRKVRTLAYEQRTANLIAAYSMAAENCEGLTMQASMTSVDWESIAQQIKERLDLA